MLAMRTLNADAPATNVRVEEHETGAVWLTVDRANKHNALVSRVFVR